MPREVSAVKRTVIDDALCSTSDPKEGLRRFLRAAPDVLANNPLYRRLITHPDEMAAVTRKLDPARIAAMDDNPGTALTEYVAAKQRAGALAGTDPDSSAWGDARHTRGCHTGPAPGVLWVSAPTTT